MDSLAHSDWEEQFTVRPEVGKQGGWTMVTCMHSHHGVIVFYLSLDQFQDNITGLISAYWVNGFTITLMPME